MDSSEKQNGERSQVFAIRIISLYYAHSLLALKGSNTDVVNQDSHTTIINDDEFLFDRTYKHFFNHDIPV